MHESHCALQRRREERESYFAFVSLAAIKQLACLR